MKESADHSHIFLNYQFLIIKYHSHFHNEIQNHILTAKKKKKKKKESHPAGQGAVIACEAEMVELARSLIKCTTSP